MGVHKIPLFDYLRGKVSHKALELLQNELKKLEHLQSINGICGHQLMTSCGLPCACRLDSYKRTDTKIPLSAIDVFWTRLNLLPEEFEKEDINIENEMEKVSQQLKSQPPLVKKCMLSKIMAVVNPEETEHQPPETQQNTRGRPTTKAQDKRNEGTQKPVVNRSRPKKNKGKTKTTILDEEFPLLVGEKYGNSIARFKEWLPSTYRRYITHIEDVAADGNCGFRSVAVGLGYKQDQWFFVRRSLIEEMEVNVGRWDKILNDFDPGCYKTLYETINWMRVEPAPVRCWMWLPYTGLLIAQKFGVIVQLLSIAGCQTFFPMFDGPDVYPDHRIVTIAFVNTNHYISVKLTEDCPIPRPNGLWRVKREEVAEMWETLYADRIAQDLALEGSNKTIAKQYINLF